MSLSCTLDEAGAAGQQVELPADEEEADSDRDKKLIGVPGKVVFLSSDISNLFKVQVIFNGCKVVAIMDTGASSSFVSESFINALNLPILTAKSDINVIGDNIHSGGKCLGSVTINKVAMESVDFIVLPAKVNINFNLILGIDFIKTNKLELNIKEKLLIKHYEDGSNIKMAFQEDGTPDSQPICTLKCFAETDVAIEEGAVREVPIRYPDIISSGEPFLFTDDIIDKVLASRVHGLTGMCDSSTKIVLLASTDSTTTIKKNQLVGTISSIMQLPESEDPVDDSTQSDSQIVSQIDLPPELQDLQKQKIISMILSCRNALSSSDNKDIGIAAVTKHHIKLYDNTPIYQRPRRLAKPIADEIERQCQELNALDIIEPSNSPWSSPVVPVRKKDGTIRLCIDYRKLNKKTIPDRHPMPNLSDSIFGLHGTQFFTQLDFRSGYYQIPIDDDSKELTAFSTPRSHWQFKRLSFGLRNAPSAFQREVQAVLSSFPSNKVIAYLDDILIMSASFEEHLQLVHKVLYCLSSHIKIKLSKCKWFAKEVKFLGHIITPTGIKKSPEYVQKIMDIQKPTTVRQLREFLGLVNFQRKFLPNCSEIQKPLSSLTGGRHSKVLDWTPGMVESFEKLKEEMKKDMELAYPDYSQDASKLELWVDASATGAGAYLAQQQHGAHRVIGFASMTFTTPQMQYSTLERELTALRWGMKTFRPFLFGVEFILYTDHQPLVYLHNMKLVCSRLTRTVEDLSEYTFDIRYTPGHLNEAADALSRMKTSEVVAAVEDSSLLPEGLVLCEAAVPGGGDSLFISIFRLLKVMDMKKLPVNADELRKLLVDRLCIEPEKFNVTLDKVARKNCKLMSHPGQLPSLDLLIVASWFFKIRIFVYFWPSQPVIYQFDHYDCVIHLQCISGIHFNPLIELKNYNHPATRCTVVTVSKAKLPQLERESGPDGEVDEVEQGYDIDNLFVGTAVIKCNHDVSMRPQVHVDICDKKFCAIFDTGAELSLISREVIDVIGNVSDLNLKKERLCNVIGLSGVHTPIEETVALACKIGHYKVDSARFAVVPKQIMPYCILLGNDFMCTHGVSLNLLLDICSIGKYEVKFLSCNLVEYYKKRLCVVQMGGRGGHQGYSHTISIENSDSDLRFEFAGSSGTVSKIRGVIEDDVVEIIQKEDRQLRLLKRSILESSPTKQWPKQLGQYSRHFSKLAIVNNILVFKNPYPIIIVSFRILVELLMMLHYKLAHIGRDKLLDLLSTIAWHPSQYRVATEVATTCHQCQLLKIHSTPINPPT